MGLALVVGPAKAGKIARLLDDYLDAIDRDPVLIVPNAADVERIERDLLRRTSALLSGSIGTFDDVFRELAQGGRDARPVAGDAQRTLLVRRAIARTSLNGLGRSARFGGFADALLAALAELESGLLDPEELDGDLARLHAAYRAELDSCGLWDRDGLRRRAVERLRTELEAWNGRPVFAYGFEDLTGAEWGLLETLAGRTEVTVSLPYEPARAAFASLERTIEDLAALADGRIDELPATVGAARAPCAGSLGASPLRRRAAGRAGARRDDPLLRGLGDKGRARARGRGDPRARRGRDPAARDRPCRAGARAVAGSARDRPRHPGDSIRRRGPRPPGADAVRPVAAGSPALRVAGGPTPRPLRVSSLAVLRLRPLERRLPRRATAGPGDLGGCARRGGDELVARRSADPGARGATVGDGSVGRYPSTDPDDGQGRSRARSAADDDRGPAGSPRPRRGPASARRARPLGCPRRRAFRRRAPRDARACRSAARAGGRDGARRRPRSVPRANPPLRLGLRARPRGGKPAAPGTGFAVPRRRDPRRAREPHARPAHEAGLGLAGSLSLLHRVHPRDPTAHPRPGGGDRRGEPSRAESVLGRGRVALRLPTTSRAGRAGGRSPSSRGRSTPRRPSGSASARSRNSRRASQSRRMRWRSPTAGSGGSIGREGRS